MSDPQLDPRDIAALFDRTRLRLARELRGFTQVQLAREVGSVTAASISQFENGHARPASSTLHRLSVVLRVPLPFFAAPARPPVQEEVGGFFRSLRSTSPRDRQQALAFVHLARELALELEKYVALPSLNLPRIPVDEDVSIQSSDVEQAAAQVRHQWNVPAGPIYDVVRLLERNGIVVVRFRVSIEKVDAFCVDFSDRPVVALGADKGLRDRSRFDAAHELGHLVLHGVNGKIGDKLTENQANEFAAAFLMPAEEIRNELPDRLDWPAFLHLKAKWHVSLAALLVRAKTLGVMSEHTYAQAWKALSVRGWRKVEPGALGNPEVPVLLHRALALMETTGISFREFINRSGLPELDIHTLLDSDIIERPRVEL
ncbi:helix-turn-helix domain-containing protein [Nonomuraea jabiensis]|uniref:Zn-dependent peptidase ImmA (M78 family)/DNA-binding XRE family transcriptional regulator n=1 Tax=Nonomuraea jabiensis TaxID=882448 RepID=A0A7W9FYX7_9ACTN|nr:XRE family transcriptional regulator [Nonomuraea jabiensis]MBB5774066.1 Zn-dependent peptidase ImmA (M78 family)/DNA-binding XRE family transcriptional regulator [Nonomuraea jabiensis]